MSRIEGTEPFDRASWEARYRTATPGRLRPPNPHLVDEIADLGPGAALDVGCGEGAEAIWLAERGWRVTAVDIADTALERARTHAEMLDREAGARIAWVQADPIGDRPVAGRFDLVTSHYVHPSASRERLVHRLAEQVNPGGTLLVVGHHPSDPHALARPAGSQVHFTAEELAAVLDSDAWDIVTCDVRSRSIVRPHGGETTLRDTVLRARRR